jgi:peptidoglycan/xylan/chitin deacetylase (PgdA/CDA1 family)
LTEGIVSILVRVLRAAKALLPRALCALGGARLLRWLSRRAFPGGVRVLYCHDIAPMSGSRETCVRAPGSLDAAEFERRLAHIQRYYGFISADDVRRRLQGERVGGALPVALTFDDGYRSFVTQVYPMLRRHHVPAALFVTTGAVGTTGLWTDDARALVEQAAANGLTLRLSGRELRLDGPASLADATEALIMELKRLPDASCRSALDHLRSDVGGECRPHNRMLSWDELQMLSRDSLVTIGAHTVTHPVLSCTQDEQAREEIASSGHELRDRLDIPVTAFSYPNGGREDFAAKHEQMVAEAGFDLAFSTIPGVALAGDNVYAIPRTCLASEPWPRFVLRMAGMDDLLSRVLRILRRRVPHPCAPPAAAEAGLPLQPAETKER